MPRWPAIAHLLADDQIALSPAAERSSVREDGPGGSQADRATAPMQTRDIRFWLSTNEALVLWVGWAIRHGHSYFAAPAAMVPGEVARIIDGMAGVTLTAHVAADRSLSWTGACEIERPT